MSVKVRFAPSPTGLLHIGNIRAALFNWLFAHKRGGVFMLRLDDTDQKRSTPEFAEAIKRDLTWLGLKWEAFGRQSDRLARYMEELEKLKASGRVYPCYETQEELDLKRKTQLGRGLPPIYDRAALKLTEADRENLEAQGRIPHWRFKLEHKDTTWEDLIQGRKVYPAASTSDPVLVRADGVPLYTFCSVVDDIDDNVTHIIRGEDHVTNTSVQIQIWQAMTNAPPPSFAHFPLISSASGEEMSKRLGTLSVSSMRDEMKIEAMAINSLLAKMGTSEAIAPRLTLEELAAEFDIGKISHSPPKFDIEDLKALNAKVLHLTPFALIKDRLPSNVSESLWNAARSNLNALDDITQWAKVVSGPVSPVINDAEFLIKAAELLPQAPWDDQTWHKWTDAIKAATGRKGKDLFMPLRLALTACEHGPEMKFLLPMIGEARTRGLLSGQAI